jgi:hypothetical protein
LNFLKNQGSNQGGKFYLGPPFEIFSENFFPGRGYTLPTPPLVNPVFNSYFLVSEKIEVFKNNVTGVVFFLETNQIMINIIS